MAQDYGLVRFRAASTAEAIVDAIAEMIAASGDHYWEIDAAVTGGVSGQLALRPSLGTPEAGFAIDQRVVLLADGSAQIRIGYAPAGGLGATFADIITTPPPTGLRNITASATGFAGVTGVYLVEYRDDADVPEEYRASSLAIFLATATTFTAACHVGRIISTSNASDLLPAVNLYGDGLLTGTPNATGWLTGSSSTTNSTHLHSSIIRTGDTRWSYAGVVDAYAAGSVPLASVGGVARPTPYTMWGNGNAAPTIDAARYAGILGETKYLRAYTSAQAHLVRLVPADPASQQAWLFWRFTTTDHNQTILWAKAEQ